jgi:uncharacterized membrane protein YjjB (DUF3815 family)
MLCCAVGVAAVATGAIGWRRFRRFLYEHLAAQSLIAATAAAAIALTATGLVAEHFLRHAHHADETALLSDPGVLPLCRGDATVDRITDLASIEE